MKRLLPFLLLACGPALAQTGAIKLNQIGFLPQSQKLAVAPQGAGERFEVIGADGKTAYSGVLGAAASWDASGETVRVADFSWLATPGAYRLKVDGLPASDPFTVAADGYRALNSAALKAFYFNRSAIALAPQYAGQWARAAGHPDTRVLVHTSAASKARPAGTAISSPKGWYDAGDYNKYVVNSGISTYTLLAAFEHFPAWFAQDIAIPESGNGVPDIVDEAMWNLEWMLSMQDPADGGVYHKLTNLRFDGMVMPDAATKERYVVAKSTAAALDFAATMAAASRVLAAYDKQWPGMSARMLDAAQRAWRWAEANPALLFKNPKDVVTGEYGDAHVEDEFAWAAAELFITTGKDAYLKALRPETVAATTPSWSDVRGLAWMSLAHHRERLGPQFDRSLVASRIDGLAQGLAAEWKRSAYRLPTRGADMVWGSSAVTLNQAMMLLQAYRLNGRQDYLLAAQSGLDYVLGRNATGLSFVTGFGARQVRQPHHRPSIADGVDAPVPGWLSGGPNPGQQDAKDCPPYPSKLPALSFIDHACSYASNEVAINWNAPLVYVSAALSELTPKVRPLKAMNDKLVPLDVLLRQEQLLQFDRFDNDTALEIGLKLVEMARAQKKAVTVEIARNGTVLFAHGMNGTSRDNFDWIRRKSNLVNRTGHSSFYTHNQVRLNGGDHDAIPALDPREYAAHGGSFPLTIKGTGQVGTITVSGLPGVEDHALVVNALKDYLKVEGI
jgi:endoglucanase